MHKGGWGGQPNRILTVALGLKKRGHYVIIAAPKGATLIDRARKEGISVFDNLRFPKKFNPSIYAKEVMRILQIIKDKKINVVHTHGSQDTWVAAVAAWLANPRPLVIRTRHNIFPVKNHLFNRLLYRILIDGVIVVSEGVTEVFRKTGVLGEKLKDVKSIYSVVNAQDKFNPKKIKEKNIKQQLGIPPHVPVIVKVARIAREKGHIYFLNTAKEILKKMPSVYFFALGEGPLKESLKTQAKELGIEGNVKFLGFRSDVDKILKISDVFLFTPIAGESLGTAALEALAMETPVVTFDIGGVRASVVHEKTGFVVGIKDTKNLTYYTLKLLLDKKLKKRLAKLGRRWMIKIFNEDGLIERNLKFYKNMLK